MRTVVLAMVLVTSSFAFGNDHSTDATPKWEYQIVELAQGLSADHIRAQLKSLGDNGWEMIGVAPNPKGGSEIAIFKRKVLGIHTVAIALEGNAIRFETIAELNLVVMHGKKNSARIGKNVTIELAPTLDLVILRGPEADVKSAQASIDDLKRLDRKN